MDATQPTPTDPIDLVRQLDAAVIRRRLQDLTRERAALLVLLRAAQRIERNPDREQEAATCPA